MQIAVDIWLNDEPIKVLPGHQLGIVQIKQDVSAYPAVNLFFGHELNPVSETIDRMVLLRDELSRQIDEISRTPQPPPLPRSESVEF